MNCLEFRHQILTDPYRTSAEAEAHLADCAQCTRFRQEVLVLDSDIEQALSVEVPEGLTARVMLNQSLKRRRFPVQQWGIGLAASILVAVMGSYLLLSDTEPALQTSALVAHAGHQKHNFYGSEHEPIGQAELATLMARLNLNTSIEHVVYAAVCPVDGDRAAHLVIKDHQDQYTVMLLPEHSPNKRFTINDEVWQGFVSPHPAGALAVLAEADDAHAIGRIREVMERLQSEIYLSAEL